MNSNIKIVKLNSEISSILINFFIGRALIIKNKIILRKKIILSGGISFNLLLLGFFK